MMKRLFLFVFAAVFAASLVLAVNTPVAEAAKKKKVVKAAPSINIDAIVGKNIGEITAAYGKQSRVDESEYGFNWYVYKNDYKRFMMLGVKDGQVVAAYCNSTYLSAQGFIRLGVTRDSVRNQLGDPITTMQRGNDIYVLPNTDQNDIFLIDGYYLRVYYDAFDSFKVTSILKIKQEYEDQLFGKKIDLTPGMLKAYSNESIDLVNSMRARKGLTILTEYGKANELAMFRSTDMRDRGYFSHYSPEGKSPAYFAAQRGIKIRSLCENIACGHRTAISAFEAFMNSKGHRNNVLYKKVKQIGAGTAYGGDRSVIVTYILLTKK